MYNSNVTTLTFTNSSTLGSMNFANRVMHSLGETLAGDTEVEVESIEMRGIRNP